MMETGGVKTITAEQAKSKRGAVILDVRLERKTSSGMADGSINIPLYQVCMGTRSTILLAMLSCRYLTDHKTTTPPSSPSYCLLLMFTAYSRLGSGFVYPPGCLRILWNLWHRAQSRLPGRGYQPGPEEQGDCHPVRDGRQHGEQVRDQDWLSVTFPEGPSLPPPGWILQALPHGGRHRRMAARGVQDEHP